MANDEDADRPGAPLSRHPAILAAVITGALGLVTAVVTGVFQRAPTTADPLLIEEVQLGSTVGSFNVRCPTTIVFEGRISVSGGRGDVAYRLVHTDGFSAGETSDEVKVVHFEGPGSAPVRYEWQPSIPKGEVSRTAAIEVLRPVSKRSKDVTVTGICDADLPPGPSVPPPQVSPPGG